MLNRNIAPEIQSIEKISYLKAQKKMLSNGLPVYYISAGNQEIIKIDFVFEAGTWQQKQKLIAGLTAFMLQEGSEHYSAPEIAKTFDFFGAYFSASADQNFATVSVVCLSKYLPEILKITEDILKRSVFPQHELDVLISKQKQKFKVENEKVKVLCQKKFTQTLFGAGHPYATNNKLLDFDKISREQLIDFYQKHYHSGNCRMIVSGQVDGAVLDLIEQHFGQKDWQAEPISSQDIEIRSSSERMHRQTKKGSLQSAIRIGKLWPEKSHPDTIGLSVLITLLGGYFGSRLMMNIREDKGYTYGIGASVLYLKNAAYFVISTEVGNEYTQATLNEIDLELRRLQDELIEEEELETVKSYLAGEFLRDFDGPFALASSFRAISDFGLDYDFYDRYLNELNQITSEKLQRLAQKYLSPSEMVTVVVGEN